MVRGPVTFQTNQPKGRWSRRCARRLWGNFLCLHPWNGSCLATSVLGFLGWSRGSGRECQIPTAPRKKSRCAWKRDLFFFKGKIIIQSNHHFWDGYVTFQGSTMKKDAPAAGWENHMRFDFIPLSASSGDFWNQSIWKNKSGDDSAVAFSIDTVSAMTDKLKSEMTTTPILAVIKTLVTFHSTGWLIGILILACDNP